MIDQILSTLEKEAGPVLISKLGLDKHQASSCVHAAKDSVKEVLSGGNGFGLDDVLNLFSSAKNSTGAEGILGKLGTTLQGKLTQQVGLEPEKASGVQATLLPIITELISKHVGGDANKIQGLLGGLDGNGALAGAAKGMLGKLFN